MAVSKAPIFLQNNVGALDSKSPELVRVAAQVVPGFLVLAIGYLGCHIELVLITWFLAVTLVTASYAGAMASVVDIAPNFAGNQSNFVVPSLCHHACGVGIRRAHNVTFLFFLPPGPILAFAQTIHMTASFLSPLVAGFITQESVSIDRLTFPSR